MTKGDHLLDKLFERLTEGGVNWEAFNNADLLMVEQVVKPLEQIIVVSDGLNGNSHFFNDAARTYFYGISVNHASRSFSDLSAALIHPDHLDDIQRTANQWEADPHQSHNTTFRVKNFRGEWRWIHIVSKALNFKSKMKPGFIISIIHDVEKLVRTGNHTNLEQFKCTHQHLFNSLTKREMQIIEHISKGMTSGQIAEKLSIRSTTVDTHRKNMIRKLGVRTSIGLARYYLVFKSNN